MSRDIRKVDDTCEVTCLENGRTADAVVLEFKESIKLTVVLNQTIKLHLMWDGRKYLGKSSGLEFVSNGPNVKIYKVQ
jgi:hypothetical protein